MIGVAPVALQAQSSTDTDTAAAETAQAPASGVVPSSSADERSEGSRSASPADSGAEVIYPTGVIVASDEPPLYRSSQTDLASGETYVPASDLELAEDGSEHAMVTYHSSRGGGHDQAA